MQRFAVLLALALLALTAPAAEAGKHDKRGRYVDLQLLALNDFHGNLEAAQSLTTSTGAGASVLSGGAEYLATHLRRARLGQRHTITVSAGDLIGGSPLISALFHDEPTVEAMNLMGLDLNAVGNHEFDEGAAELGRMRYGGCHPTDGCVGKRYYHGAQFEFLAANVVSERTGRPIFPPYEIRKYGGVKVAFIGETLEGTPGIVAAAGIQGLKFKDEADTVRELLPELRRKGVEAIILLLHQGGSQATSTPGNYDSCNGGLTGDVMEIMARLPREVDLVISGHTHQAYNCPDVYGRRVTSASSFGRLYTDLRLTLDRRTKDVVHDTGHNKIVTRDVPADRAVKGLVERYSQLVAPLRDRVIGWISADLTTAASPSGESTMGNAIADAQLEATRAAPANAVAAFMNPGGVRANLTAAPAPGETAPGQVTYGEAFTVQPFANVLTTVTLTGAQLSELLKQQWCGQTFQRVLLPSASVRYTFDRSVADSILNTPCASAANPVSDLRVGGAAVTPTGTYRVTVNNYLADGGDNFSVLRSGTERVGGVVDLDAFATYLGSTSQSAPLTPPALDRISVQP